MHGTVNDSSLDIYFYFHFELIIFNQNIMNLPDISVIWLTSLFWHTKGHNFLLSADTLKNVPMCFSIQLQFMGSKFLFLVPNILKNIFFNVSPKKKMRTVLKRYGGLIFTNPKSCQFAACLYSSHIWTTLLQLLLQKLSPSLFIGYYQLFLKIKTENDCKWLSQDGCACVFLVTLTKWTHVTQITNKLVCVLIQGREVWIAFFWCGFSHHTVISTFCGCLNAFENESNLVGCVFIYLWKSQKWTSSKHVTPVFTVVHLTETPTKSYFPV